MLNIYSIFAYYLTLHIYLIHIFRNEKKYIIKFHKIYFLNFQNHRECLIENNREMYNTLRCINCFQIIFYKGF